MPLNNLTDAGIPLLLYVLFLVTAIVISLKRFRNPKRKTGAKIALGLVFGSVALWLIEVSGVYLWYGVLPVLPVIVVYAATIISWKYRTKKGRSHGKYTKKKGKDSLDMINTLFWSKSRNTNVQTVKSHSGIDDDVSMTT
jgi:hypothetical protein